MCSISSHHITIAIGIRNAMHTGTGVSIFAERCNGTLPSDLVVQ
jgi:hypothetical protein